MAPAAAVASIAPGGVLKVGPQSAGANPGPACYERGGTAPTLTDALVVLGHLSDIALLGGAMPISRQAAWRAIEEHVAAPLEMDAREAALGVLTVLATHCMSAMRTITVERGYDPREFTLVAFGGIGPTIAWRIAAELGIGRILVPRDPGAFSAWGMLVTDVHQEHSVTRVTPLDQATPTAVHALFAALEERGLADLVNENLLRERIHALRTAGMRYRGQSYEVSVPVGAVAGPSDLERLAQAFHEAHRRRYGHMAQNEAVEIVNFKVTAVGVIAKPRLKPAPIRAGHPPRPAATRQAYFGHRLVDAPIFRRHDLARGHALAGPAIIEEQTSTTVLAPGQRASIDEYLNIEIDFGAPR